MSERRRRALLACTASAAVIGLTGCLATAPTVGSGSGTQVTGAAAGATAEGVSSTLERCPETLGTIRINEDTNASWFNHYRSRYRMNSTVPMLRTMIQQSNCFVIVERGRAARALDDERRIVRGKEGRSGSGFGEGQVAGADFTLSPEIVLSEQGGSGGSLGGVARNLLGADVARLVGNVRSNEAATVLLLIDNRSTVQIAAAEGYSRNFDLGVAGSIFNAVTGVSGSAFERTPEGKVVVAAFMDSYNKMVRALREYRAQTVQGGLGRGGRLPVQGGQTPSAREVQKR